MYFARQGQILPHTDEQRSHRLGSEWVGLWFQMGSICFLCAEQGNNRNIRMKKEQTANPSQRIPVQSEGTGSEEEAKEALWSISAVSRTTGLSAHTLRAWERRFGTPTPVRLSSQHRRYTQDQVEHLQLVAKALGRGHRAGDIVPLSTSKIRDLLSVTDTQQSEKPVLPSWLEQMMEKVVDFDREGLYQTMLHDSSRLGVQSFIQERVTPLVECIGISWRKGEIGIRHEHFATEILEDVLRTLRMPLEPKSKGPSVLLATLPEEQHALGLQIAALMLTMYEYNLHILGAQTPVEDIVAAAEAMKPSAVGLSVTMHTVSTKTSLQLRQLRNQLPDNIALWVGGAGAGYLEDVPSGVKVFSNLDDIALPN